MGATRRDRSMEAASARANIPHLMKVDSPMPSFEGATQWLNHATPKAKEASGRPTLVHFWSITSEISEANLPRVAELRDRRKREGLRPALPVYPAPLHGAGYTGS